MSMLLRSYGRSTFWQRANCGRRKANGEKRTAKSGSFSHFRTAELVRNLHCQPERLCDRLLQRQLYAAALQCFQQPLRWSIAHQHILRERTAAEAADGRVEAPTTHIISRQHFGRRLIATAVQVDPNFYTVELLQHRP